jgi:hypothetical protein
MSVTRPEPNGSVYVPDPPSQYGAVPTVRVITPEVEDGWMEINASDFDAEIHTLFTGDVTVEYPPGRFVHR